MLAFGYALLHPGETDRLARESMAMAAACGERGLDLCEILTDAEADRDRGLERPGLELLLARLARGEAECLAVADLGSLMLPAATVGALVEWLSGARAGLLVADLELDTRTPAGRVAARALIAAGDLDRRKLRERTRLGLAAARRNGSGRGRPAVADRPDLRRRIASWRAAGLTLQAIADRLNAEGIPTLRGGSMWRPSSVQVAAGYSRPRRVSLPIPVGARR